MTGKLRPLYEDKKFVVLLPVVLVGLFVLLLVIKTGGTSDPSADVKVACRQLVREELKAPRIADFSDEKVTADNSGSYTVHGVVDSQNSSGVKEQATFDCVTRYSTTSTTTNVTLTVNK